MLASVQHGSGIQVERLYQANSTHTFERDDQTIHSILSFAVVEGETDEDFVNRIHAELAKASEPDAERPRRSATVLVPASSIGPSAMAGDELAVSSPPIDAVEDPSEFQKAIRALDESSSSGGSPSGEKVSSPMLSTRELVPSAYGCDAIETSSPFQGKLDAASKDGRAIEERHGEDDDSIEVSSTPLFGYTDDQLRNEPGMPPSRSIKSSPVSPRSLGAVEIRSGSPHTVQDRSPSPEEPPSVLDTETFLRLLSSAPPTKGRQEKNNRRYKRKKKYLSSDDTDEAIIHVSNEPRRSRADSGAEGDSGTGGRPLASRKRKSAPQRGRKGRATKRRRVEDVEPTPSPLTPLEPVELYSSSDEGQRPRRLKLVPVNPADLPRRVRASRVKPVPTSRPLPRRFIDFIPAFSERRSDAAGNARKEVVHRLSSVGARVRLPEDLSSPRLQLGPLKTHLRQADQARKHRAEVARSGKSVNSNLRDRQRTRRPKALKLQPVYVQLSEGLHRRGSPAGAVEEMSQGKSTPEKEDLIEECTPSPARSLDAPDNLEAISEIEEVEGLPPPQASRRGGSEFPVYGEGQTIPEDKPLISVPRGIDESPSEALGTDLANDANQPNTTDALGTASRNAAADKQADMDLAEKTQHASPAVQALAKALLGGDIATSSIQSPATVIENKARPRGKRPLARKTSGPAKANEDPGVTFTSRRCKSLATETTNDEVQKTILPPSLTQVGEYPAPRWFSKPHSLTANVTRTKSYADWREQADGRASDAQKEYMETWVPIQADDDAEAPEGGPSKPPSRASSPFCRSPSYRVSWQNGSDPIYEEGSVVPETQDPTEPVPH